MCQHPGLGLRPQFGAPGEELGGESALFAWHLSTKWKDRSRNGQTIGIWLINDISNTSEGKNVTVWIHMCSYVGHTEFTLESQITVSIAAEIFLCSYTAACKQCFCRLHLRCPQIHPSPHLLCTNGSRLRRQGSVWRGIFVLDIHFVGHEEKVKLTLVWAKFVSKGVNFLGHNFRRCFILLFADEACI